MSEARECLEEIDACLAVGDLLDPVDCRPVNPAQELDAALERIVDSTQTLDRNRLATLVGTGDGIVSGPKDGNRL